METLSGPGVLCKLQEPLPLAASITLIVRQEELRKEKA